jgi:hypothetical protein
MTSERVEAFIGWQQSNPAPSRPLLCAGLCNLITEIQWQDLVGKTLTEIKNNNDELIFIVDATRLL